MFIFVNSSAAAFLVMKSCFCESDRILHELLFFSSWKRVLKIKNQSTKLVARFGNFDNKQTKKFVYKGGIFHSIIGKC